MFLRGIVYTLDPLKKGLAGSFISPPPPPPYIQAHIYISHNKSSIFGLDTSLLQMMGKEAREIRPEEHLLWMSEQ